MTSVKPSHSNASLYTCIYILYIDEIHAMAAGTMCKQQTLAWTFPRCTPHEYQNIFITLKHIQLNSLRLFLLLYLMKRPFSKWSLVLYIKKKKHWNSFFLLGQNNKIKKKKMFPGIFPLFPFWNIYWEVFFKNTNKTWDIYVHAICNHYHCYPLW